MEPGKRIDVPDKVSGAASVEVGNSRITLVDYIQPPEVDVQHGASARAQLCDDDSGGERASVSWRMCLNVRRVGLAEDLIGCANSSLV